MSMWGKLAAIGVGATAFIPGMAPIAIPAAAGIWAADSTASAAKDAAKTANAAADKAMAQNASLAADTRGVLDRNFQATQGAFNPYMAVGGAAAGTLGQLIGLPAGTAAGGQPWAQAGQAATSSAAPPATSGAGVGAGTAGAASPQQVAAGKNAGTLASSAGLVRLKAPDGSVRAMPQAQAQYYLQRGASLADDNYRGQGAGQQPAF